ncbi:hypothetical protein Tco_0352013 [Tanacetum coccineum]
MASMGSSPFLNTGTVKPKSMIERGVDCLSIVEIDKVIHTVEIDIVKLAVEIESFGMSSDEFDKETGSSDGLQPKQADLSCVHALNELHLNEIHVVPNKHEADQFVNGQWMWPQAWLLKAPNLSTIPTPNIDPSKRDMVLWTRVSSLSCIRGRLRTQGQATGNGMADMDLLPPTLHQIVTHLAPMAKHRTARSVIGRLLLAASAYFIWIERNNRLFKNSRKTSEEIRDCIMVTVRLKLLTFRFKNKAMVSSLLAKWNMPSNFRIYGT